MLAKKQMHVIYTSFPQRGDLEPLSANDVCNLFSLKRLNFINKSKIYEYIFESDTNIIESILKNLKNKIHQGEILK